MALAVPWTTAWIIGASSGIGRQLAIDLARQGVRVAVSARSRDALDALSCSDPLIEAVACDVAHGDDVATCAKAVVDALGEIDLVVCCAAVWHPMGAADFDAERANHSVAINVAGINNVLGAVMPAMIARRSGQIALVSSIAGYRGLPKAAAYGPTKAALINLAESLHPDLTRYGVTLSVVNPGFVDTPMSAKNTFAMPFRVTAKVASRNILAGLKKRKFEIAFPWQLVTILKAMRLMPYALFFWYVRTHLLRNKR